MLMRIIFTIISVLFLIQLNGNEIYGSTELPKSYCSSTYTKYKYMHMHWESKHQIKPFITQISVTECKKRCNNHPSCRGVGHIEEHNRRCELHDITLKELMQEQIDTGKMGREGDMRTGPDDKHIIFDKTCVQECQAHPSDGSHKTSPGSWPWMVSLQRRGYPGLHICSGSIIDRKTILTAAQCLHNYTADKFNEAEELVVVVGLHVLSANNTDTQFLQVKNYIIHPNYSENSNHQLDNDIAILHTDVDIKFSDKVMPACLATKSMEFKHKRCYVTGWSMTKVVPINEDTTSANSDTLKEVGLSLHTDIMCKLTGISLTENMLCGGTYDFENETCQEKGGSGSPVVCLDSVTGQWFQFGIVMWDYGCPWKNYFGVFTEVGNYEQFIDDNKAH